MEVPGGASISVRMFGPLELTVEGHEVPRGNRRDWRDLVAFLALHANRELNADWVAAMFWPANADSKDDLRHSVYELRKALGPAKDRVECGSTLRLAIAEPEIDLLRFEAAVATATPSSLRTAEGLYRGPLLQGLESGWAARAREDTQERYLQVLRLLIRDSAAAKDAHAEAHYLARWTWADPDSMSRWRDRMFAELRASEPVKALDVYLKCVAHCRRERGCLPPKYVTEVYDKLREQLNHGSGGLNGPALETEAVGGAMPMDARCYVVREADGEFHAAIERGDGIIGVRGPRQVGKSSLLTRGVDRCRQSKRRVAVTDLQALGSEPLASLGALCHALAGSLAAQLELPSPSRTWEADRAPTLNLEVYLRTIALAPESGRLVWALDELDRLFDRPYRDELFGWLRAFFNRRAFEPNGPAPRLTFLLAYSLEARMMIRDLNQSPFNVGTHLTLEDFDETQVAELNRLHDSALKDRAEILRLRDLAGGHPYLVRRALYAIRIHGRSLAELEADADREGGEFADHLSHVHRLLLEDLELLEIARGMVRGEPCRDEEGFSRLRSAGVLAGATAARARFRCGLYARYLRRKLA